MKKSLSALCALLWLGCLSEPEAEELAVSEETINGTINFATNCTPAQRTLITNAMNVVVQQLNGGDLLACLREASMSSEPWAFPEEILRAMRENKPTRISCEHLDNGWAGQAPHNDSNENLKLDPDYLANPCGWSSTTCPSGVSAEEAVASLLLHEVSHNKNYRHPDQSSATEYKYTIPEQLQTCSHSISRGNYANLPTGSVPIPTGAMRSESLARVELAAVGGQGGAPFAMDACAPNRFARGFNLRTGSKVDAMAMFCAQPDGHGDLFTYPWRGGSGGTASTMDCGPGKLMVGVAGRAQAGLDAITPLCAEASAVASGSVGYGSSAPRGGSGGLQFVRQCPQYMAVKAFRTREWDRVDQLVIACQQVFDPRASQYFNLPFQGNQASTYYRENCPTGAMVSLFGQAGAKLDRVGAECEELQRLGGVLGRAGTPRAVPARGGRGGTAWAPDACPFGEAIVGFNFRTGSRIDQIQAVCASVSAWDQGLAPPLTTLAPHGGVGGTASVVRCPHRYFVSSWFLTTADGLVSSITGACERF